MENLNITLWSGTTSTHNWQLIAHTKYNTQFLKLKHKQLLMLFCHLTTLIKVSSCCNLTLYMEHKLKSTHATFFPSIYLLPHSVFLIPRKIRFAPRTSHVTYPLVAHVTCPKIYIHGTITTRPLFFTVASQSFTNAPSQWRELCFFFSVTKACLHSRSPKGNDKVKNIGAKGTQEKKKITTVLLY